MNLKHPPQIAKTMNVVRIDILLLLLGLISIRSQRALEQEIHLIPKGYTGVISIFFDQPQGKEKRYENGIRVYDLDSNGILVTQFSLQQGTFFKGNCKFFYVDIEGQRQLIPDPIFEDSFIDSNQIVARSGGVKSIRRSNCRVKNLKHILYYVVDSLKDNDYYPVPKYKCSDIPINVIDNE